MKKQNWHQNLVTPLFIHSRKTYMPTMYIALEVLSSRASSLMRETHMNILNNHNAKLLKRSVLETDGAYMKERQTLLGLEREEWT